MKKKKVNKGRFGKKISKKKNFFNKKVNDLTVGETVAYGAVCSVVAIIVSLIPLAVIDVKEKIEDNRKPMYDPETGFKINYSDTVEEVDDTEEV